MMRKYILGWVLIIALAWLSAVPAMADSGSALEAVRARGVLRVGTAGDYQPMSYLDPETNTYVGFDAALAEDLAASLGVEIEYVATSWPTLMEDTLAGKFDLAICGITITDARKEQALMSEGYLDNGKTVLCRSEDADKYTSLEAINRPEVRVITTWSAKSHWRAAPSYSVCPRRFPSASCRWATATGPCSSW